MPVFQPKVRKDITFGAKRVDPSCQCVSCRGEIQFQAPSELVDAFIEGKVALFVGAGVSSEGPGVQRDNFLDQINHELGNKDKERSFPDVMEDFCKRTGGRAELIERIQVYFEYIYSHRDIYDRATRFHSQLATFFPIDTIITTNWDTYFEDECGATAFVTDSDIALWNAAKRKVLKIHGTIANFGSIVATRSDYQAYAHRLNTGVLGKFLTSLLATRTVVFIGYSLRDDDFLQIYRVTREHLADFHRQAYFIVPSITDDDRKRIESMGLRVIQTDGEFFVAQLKQHAQSVKCICSDSMYGEVAKLLGAVIAANGWLRKTFSIKRQPQYLISSWYLDGLQHGLERILRLRKTGEYSDLHRVIHTAHTYLEFLKRYLRDKKFDDAAYCAGFAYAMIFASQNPNKRMRPPLFYYFHDHVVWSRSAYKRIINKLPKLYKAPNRFLRKFATEYNEGMVIVHMAQLDVGKYLNELDARQRR